MDHLGPTIVQSMIPYYFASNAKQYNKIMKKHDNPERGFPLADMGDYGAVTIRIREENPSTIYIIVCMRVDLSVSLIEAYALLVHEAMHVWRYIRKYLREDKPSREFEAYAMQHICTNLFAEYDAERNKLLSVGDAELIESMGK